VTYLTQKPIDVRDGAQARQVVSKKLGISIGKERKGETNN
jgi:hypothetical protein